MVPCMEELLFPGDWHIFSFEVCVLLLVASGSPRFWCGLYLTLILGKKERAHHPY